MPIHLDLEWREAQLGQLTAAADWLGPRLARRPDRGIASGRHRGCGRDQDTAARDGRSSRRICARRADGLRCQLRLSVPLFRARSGEPGLRLSARRRPHSPGGETCRATGLPHLSVELDRIPVAAGLDALRTVRSDFGPAWRLRARSAARSAMRRLPSNVHRLKKPAREERRGRRGERRIAKMHAACARPLTGSFTVEGFQLSGDGLSTPIQASSWCWSRCCRLPRARRRALRFRQVSSRGSGSNGDDSCGRARVRWR
jgi:hypothetical protein